MHARECTKCAAPLPEGPEDQPVACPYCGTVNEPTVARPTPLQAMLQQEEIKREAVAEAREEIKEELKASWLQPGRLRPSVQIRVTRGGNNCGCCCGPLVLGVLVLAALVANAPAGDRLRNLREVAHLAGLKMKVEDLATFRDQQRAVLDAPLPEGPFDPGARALWALDLARRWSPEARLAGIRAVRVRRDGTVDPADPRAETTFVFESAAKAQESLAKEARQASEITHGLRLRIVQDRVEARLAFGAPPKQGPQVTTLPLAKLLDLARASGRLPDEPVYQATLSVDNGLALWRLDAIGTPASVFMRASDGRMLR